MEVLAFGNVFLSISKEIRIVLRTCWPKEVVLLSLFLTILIFQIGSFPIVFLILFGLGISTRDFLSFSKEER